MSCVNGQPARMQKYQFLQYEGKRHENGNHNNA